MIRFPYSRSSRRVGVIAAAVLAVSAAPALAADGVLDATFDGDGRVTTSFPTNLGFPTLATFSGVAVQPDGKVVAIGTVRFANGVSRMIVARYTTNGSPDSSFGGGRVLIDFPNSWDLDGRDLVLLPGGDIVIVGTIHNGAVASDSAIALARLRGSGPSAGRLDPLFGTGGLAVQAPVQRRSSSVPSGSIIFEQGTGIVLAAGGTRLLVSGTGQSGGRNVVVTAVFDLQGQPVDRGPALPGNLDVTSTPLFANHGGPHDVAPYRAGGLVTVSTADGTGLGLLAVDADGFAQARDGGPFDNHIGMGSARWLARFAGASDTVDSAVAADPTGERWVEVGSTFVGGVARTVVARFTANGLDRSFSADGTALFDLPGVSWGQDVAVQRDGKIVIASQSSGRIALLRLLPDGEPDRSFGSDGLVLDDVPGSNLDSVFGVAIGADGKAVVAGADVAAGGERRFLVERYGPQSLFLPCGSLLGCLKP